jgi:large subunit ribosomal protein L4
MNLKVYRQDGSESGDSVTLEDTVFGIEPNDHAIWLDVRRIQASARQGTHKSKERSETAGSTRKLYRQKGTGGARAGDAKSPTRRSGGTAFGPKPHAYNLKVNRQVQALARRSALSHKAAGAALRIVEDFSFDTASTRSMRSLLQALELAGRPVLVLTGSHEPAVYQSGRNLPKVKVRSATNASTLDLMGAQVIVMQKGAVDVLTERLGSKAQNA